MKQRVFLCKHCQHELQLPRAGMHLQKVKSWFRYARCPHCKHELRVVERAPEPVIPAAIQPPLWTGTAGEDAGLVLIRDAGKQARTLEVGEWAADTEAQQGTKSA